MNLQTSRRMRQIRILFCLSALWIVAACTAPPSTPTPTSNAATIVVPFTPNPQDVPLPTLLPTVALQASPIPITVAPNTILTVTPIPITATRSAPTRPPNTPTPAETATPFPEGIPKVYVTALRVEPEIPKANEGGTFFVTFQNASGEPQAYRWAVEIWREDERRPFGLTAIQAAPMPIGVTTLTASGWAPRGQGECIFYRAKAVALDEEDNRADFIQIDGTLLWLGFNVCP